MNSDSAKKILGRLFLILAHSLCAQANPGASDPSRISSTNVQVVSGISVTGREAHAGDAACRGCHANEVDSYFSTPHHLSSRFPSRESILGPFEDGKNILRTSNPNLYFQMESRPEGFYQSAVWAFAGSPSKRSEKISIVIGSGRVGQTYLYWQNDLLFQLPVSYWIDLGTWVNSPGYRDGTANFDRLVVPRCLECHMSYAELAAAPSPPNAYKPESMVVGISCERCHGPAREHVEAMRAKKAGSRIIDPLKLSREQQIEACAQCHGGRRIPVAPAFTYVPGQPLDAYFRQDSSKPGFTADVHGNQVALLQMSRCYQASTNMTCSTCHDVHQTQRNAAAFSTHCLECHRAQACGEFSKLKATIAENCVDCHMPVQASRLVFSNSNGSKTHAMVRSHWIKVYPETQTQ